MVKYSEVINGSKINISFVIYGVIISVKKMVDVNKEGGDVGVWPWGSKKMNRDLKKTNRDMVLWCIVQIN